MGDLRLHSDDEIAELLGSPVDERTTIHEWPLSCVQRIVLGDGRVVAYKSQLPPTVEVEFYGKAQSALLPGHRDLGLLGECSTMTLDWIDAPLLRDVLRGEPDLVDRGRDLVSRIARIDGDLPTHVDVGSVAAWSAVVDDATSGLEALVDAGRFTRVSRHEIDGVREWAVSPETLDTVSRDPSVSHGDLKADQVFVLNDGYRVIDWQRPVLGPRDLDLVSLLVEGRLDPRAHVDGAVVGVFWLLRLRWAIEAQIRIFPGFPGSLFERWSAQAVRRIVAGAVA